MNKVLLSNKITSGQVNELLAKKDRIIERQSNMVSGQVNQWTSEPVACLLADLCTQKLVTAARGDSSARQNHYGKDTWRTRL